MPKCDFNKVAKNLYWNYTSAWVFSCKFAAYFQNTSGRQPLAQVALPDYCQFTKELRNWDFWSPNDFILLDCEIVFQVHYVCGRKRGPNLRLNCHFSKKKKCSYLNNNSLSVYVLEMLFPSLKEGKNCKTLLVLWLTPESPTVFGTKQTC